MDVVNLTTQRLELYNMLSVLDWYKMGSFDEILPMVFLGGGLLLSIYITTNVYCSKIYFHNLQTNDSGSKLEIQSKLPIFQQKRRSPKLP